MHILVIAGGNSGERAVSLRSGAAVKAALEAVGHQVTTLDTANQSVASISAGEFDVAFPIIHGAGGEDGSLQQQLENIGLPYVGSDTKACGLTFDKSEYKRAVAQASILTPKGALVHQRDLQKHPITQASFVLKPYDGGSSVDTFIVRDPNTADWGKMLVAIRDKYGEMLLEELIEGVEITVGVLDDQPLPVIEIIPPQDGEFDYENKYNGATQELCPPLHISQATQNTAQKLALQIHQLTGCRDLSRTDMIVRSDNSIVVLETNTLPGMTNESLFPKAANVSGLDMPMLCVRLVQLAATRQTDAA